MKNCISCGMPNENLEKMFCKFCTNSDGSMVSYEVALDNMTKLKMQESNLDETTAKSKVKKMMKELPAWKNN